MRKVGRSAMGMSRFDEIVDRVGTGSLKYDFKEEFGYPADVLPMWVADMDFQTCPEVLAALDERVRHGIFGYTLPDRDYVDVLNGWFEPRFQYHVREDRIVKVPGAVFGVAQVIQALTRPGDGVLIQEPVYYPFRNMIEANGRKLLVNELIETDGHYEMDYEDLERQLASNDVRLVILCSPHNPVGRVWTEAELRRFGELAVRYGVPVVSDEIHMDFVFGARRHHMFASLDPAFEDITITCTSPSKTFNLAGLQLSNLFISNSELRRAVKRNLYRTGYDEPNVFGLTACVAAYRHGADWLADLLAYVHDNYRLLVDFIQHENLPMRAVELQGTYLAWVDMRPAGLTAQELEQTIVRDAKLWLDGGEMFGPSGAGFQRFNLACPKSTLRRALDGLKNAFMQD
ncbi:MAG: MalY/PatB family protein [Fastidiosipilaceae bacterium]